MLIFLDIILTITNIGITNLIIIRSIDSVIFGDT